jgi:DNA excision repair protein ERCC-2
MINDRVNTRYKERENSLESIVQSIETVVSSKIGNYIAFFPSYQYLNQVKEALSSDLDVDILVQSRQMDEVERDHNMGRFKQNLTRSQIAFFVMGGMFAEGIDYVGDMLSGVIIVGVGLPMVNEPNQQLRAYYDDTFKRGFDYAYTYPGMNKVIQAVGRVIRRDDDYGIALLMDDRFVTPLYKRLMPKEWQAKTVVRTDSYLTDLLDDFWTKMAIKYPKSSTKDDA